MGLDLAAIYELRSLSPEPVLDVVDMVWEARAAFVRWPERALLLLPGVVRTKARHEYPPDVKALGRAARVALDTRNNGPAIAAFLIAGGERPMKVGVNHGWSVHHIYDGLHPAPGRATSAHAVKRGDLFTEAAGLVAMHPIADALAAEVPYFAWQLRYEAFVRFGLDPDGVFGVDVEPTHAEEKRLEVVLAPPLDPIRSAPVDPAVSYAAKLLHFKAKYIERLSDDEVFEIRAPEATWRMTKAEFYATFPNVVRSSSYTTKRREYWYPTTPRAADRFRVS